MKNLIVAGFCLIFIARIAFGCSIPGQQIAKFDDTQYIFIGIVRGYTEPHESAKLRGQAYGLVVDVKESIYLPRTPKTNFEIFPISLWADCSLGGRPLEKLKASYPAGSEIRVIAKAAEIITAAGYENVIKLEMRPSDNTDLSLNADRNGRSLTSRDSIFDYKLFVYDSGQDPLGKAFLPSFEAIKDLLRLRNSSTQEEKNAVLDRIVYGSYHLGIDFFEVFKAYAANEAEADRYSETHLKRAAPELLPVYLMLQTAREELVKLGYSREEVEKALAKASADGAGLTAEAMVKGALKYLPLSKKN